MTLSLLCIVVDAILEQISLVVIGDGRYCSRGRTGFPVIEWPLFRHEHRIA